MESESFRVGGEFLLHATCLNLPGCTSGAKSISYTPLWHLSGFWFVRVSVTHRVMESVSSLGGWGVSLTSPVLETVWSFVGGRGWGQGKAGSLPYTPRARFSQAFRRVGETLFQAVYWNLSHRWVGE